MTRQSLSFELLHSAAACDSIAAFLPVALQTLKNATRSDVVQMLTAPSGQWVVAASSDDPDHMPPLDLLAEAADSSQMQRSGDWVIWPISVATFPNAQLAVLAADASIDRSEFKASVELLLVAVAMVVQKEQIHRRSKRLAAFLDIAGKWHQNAEMESLLTEMAEAATSLLGSERATIFLWDRRSKTLVGRPALGVESGELRIPESTGIVGQAIETGLPQRANQQNQGHIDRTVDDQLQFTTRNLLCVPLVGARGKMLGAFELINKREGDFTKQDEAELLELAVHASVAIENCHNIRNLMAIKPERGLQVDGPMLVGESDALDRIRQSIARVAPTDLPVLILGENGTGKDIVGQMIHVGSDRRPKPFVAINCAAMTETLLESEMFGHEKGAFTDAHESRAGKFESAADGTLFLDEIGELSLSCQAKLLRAIEEKVVVRVGGSSTIATDTRILAATNRDLAAMVRDRSFREDLFFRLNVVTLEIPPLRERGDDILLLATHFLEEFCLAAHRKVPRFTPAARKLLQAHGWPGNVRELRNLMERLAYLVSDDQITAEHLKLSSDGLAGNVADNLPLSEATRQFQVEYIEQQIQKAAGNMTEAAKRLGLHRSNLYRKMGQLGMADPDPDDD